MRVGIFINDDTLFFVILGLHETDNMGINNKETLPRNNHVNIFFKETSSDILRLNAGAPIDLLQMFTPFKINVFVTYVFDMDGTL